MGDCQSDADKQVVENMMSDRTLEARIVRMKAKAEDEAARQSPSTHQFHVALDAIFDEARATFDKKNADYAKQDDVLAAFRRQAEATGLSVRQVWAVHFTKQVEAVLTWSKNGELVGEGLDSRLADVLNYLAFAKTIQQEESHG